jgi:hypothetical protein
MRTASSLARAAIAWNDARAFTAYVASSCQRAARGAPSARSRCSLAWRRGSAGSAVGERAAAEAVFVDAGYAAPTLHAGNRVAANAQLDLAAARVWALLLTARMQ